MNDMEGQIVGFLRQNAVPIVVILALAAGFLLLRTRATQIDSMDAFEALIAGGEPVVVEFYGNT
jgi:hypothetical protein